METIPLTDKIEQLSESVEDALLLLATRWGPWLAPVGPAYFVGRAAHHRLDAHWVIAFIMACAVEAVGIAATHTALNAWAWNNNRRKTDPEAPFGLMLILSFVYFASAFVLSIIVEVYPVSSTYAPAVFIFLAAVAYVTIPTATRLKAWQKERDSEAERKQKERDETFDTLKAARSELSRLQSQIDTLNDTKNDTLSLVSSLEVQRDTLVSEIEILQERIGSLNTELKGVSQGVKKQKVDSSKMSKDERHERIIELSKNHTQEEIATMLNVSISTVKRDCKQLNGAVQGGAA